MIYLTKIRLDVGICRKRNIQDAYALHRLVYSFFPREKNAGRFLYADLGSAAGGRDLLILSGILPELPEEIASASTELSDRFFQFSDFNFKVLLNPVRKDGQTGKRLPITGQLPLLQWFASHAEKWGFTVDVNTLSVRTLPSVNFIKNGGECRFHRAEFCGTLHVNAPEIFRRYAEHGIGHGKAFGFGLLQLVPIQK